MTKGGRRDGVFLVMGSLTMCYRCISSLMVCCQQVTPPSDISPTSNTSPLLSLPAGKQVVVKYVGKLAANGRVFDQSKSFKFRLGVGEVIKGWDRGIVGMRVGDRRRLTIPPQMAYGPKGVKGSIPPNATLVFEVELVSVK